MTSPQAQCKSVRWVLNSKASPTIWPAIWLLNIYPKVSKLVCRRKVLSWLHDSPALLTIYMQYTILPSKLSPLLPCNLAPCLWDKVHFWGLIRFLFPFNIFYIYHTKGDLLLVLVQLKELWGLLILMIVDETSFTYQSLLQMTYVWPLQFPGRNSMDILGT